MPSLTLTGVLRRVREIAQDVAAPEAAAVDAEARWPERQLRSLLEANLGGLVIPEQVGGLGHGLLGLTRVCEELGRSCGSTAICYGMHSVGTAVISARATADQRERFLTPISEGRHITTLALSEPGTGAHFYIPEAELRDLGGEGYTVTGTKSFVTNSTHADSMVASVASGEAEAPPGTFSCVVIPLEAAGSSFGDPWSGIGMRGNDARSVELRDVLLPRGNLLGEEGDEIWYVFNVIAPYFLAAMSGTYLGIAAAALDETREHLLRRHHSHSGGALAQAPVLQHRLGAMWAHVERARRFLYHATESLEQGVPESLRALMAAKAEVAECATEVANEAMTLTGGIAYREYSSLDRHLRDARAAHVMAPTTDILRIWTGRDLLGLPLLAD